MRGLRNRVIIEDAATIGSGMYRAGFVPCFGGRGRVWGAVGVEPGRGRRGGGAGDVGVAPREREGENETRGDPADSVDRGAAGQGRAAEHPGAESGAREPAVGVVRRDCDPGGAAFSWGVLSAAADQPGGKAESSGPVRERHTAGAEGFAGGLHTVLLGGEGVCQVPRVAEKAARAAGAGAGGHEDPSHGASDLGAGPLRAGSGLRRQGRDGEHHLGPTGHPHAEAADKQGQGVVVQEPV